MTLLNMLLTQERNSHTPSAHPLFRYDLPASDYDQVARSILSSDPDQVVAAATHDTWWKVLHLVAISRSKDLPKLAAVYLHRTDRAVQWMILRSLKAAGAAELAPLIAALLDSPDESIRREALTVLVGLRAKEAVPTLTALLKDEDGLKRYHALNDLVQVGAREAAPAIAEALKVSGDNTRYWALDALVKLEAREQAESIWRVLDGRSEQNTEAYAIAALVAFGHEQAVPLAVRRATEADLTRRGEMLRRLVELKAGGVAPALIEVLSSGAVLGGNPADLGTDGNIRRDIMMCLGSLGARGAIPALRAYVRGWRGSFLQASAATTLGILKAKEAVGDLLSLLEEGAKGDLHTTSEAALALARIGDRRAWPRLIASAANPEQPYRSEIIRDLNKQLDPELWERVHTQKVRGLYWKSVKTTADSFSRESGVRIHLYYLPGKDVPAPAMLDDDGYPRAMTNVEDLTLIGGLERIIYAMSDARTPYTYTFIFDDKQIRVLPVERAVEWWKNFLHRAPA